MQKSVRGKHQQAEQGNHDRGFAELEESEIEICLIVFRLRFQNRQPPITYHPHPILRFLPPMQYFPQAHRLFPSPREPVRVAALDTSVLCYAKYCDSVHKK